MLDMTESIAPRSDQMNAEDLLSGPRTFTIAEVTKGNAEQPFNFHLAEFPHGRPFKPSKTVRRLMVQAWGKDASTYVGKRMTLYRDPEVTFGKDKPGGIRVSHMSDLPDGKALTIWLTVTRGKRAAYTVEPLPDHARTATPVDEETVARIADLRAEWHEADADRRKTIETEVAELQQPTAEDAFPEGGAS
ncbi:hypothetical protein [Nocardioides sp. YIM 152315]|uniref:hypothetical protein n=1 Tax=Nocardioides sp. YIM 152315 TaxID=3031760 RepID=UPI0023DBAEE8|nr:hypothetical protein [Nocardioides sp. YIM 152315]MDF1603369.1 hypothetical protein [Nocardioides sp. YIM 152315]